MRRLTFTIVAQCIAVAAWTGLCCTATLSAEALLVRGPDGGAVRALIIGIDAYRHYRPLKGAVADALDLEDAMRRTGVMDVTTLIDAHANRATILQEIARLVARTQANDLIVLSIAGHGAQEPEQVKGSEPDGMENVFLLPGFQPTPQGSQERILGKEFNHFIKQFEQHGARVMFIADTCHGGGMAREVDPRAETMSFRQVPSYRLTEDLLKPVTTHAEAFTTQLDFERTEFLAAVDRNTKAPEVSIPGVNGLRGALSYAVARALEGNADLDANGQVTVKELFTNVRQVVYQLSNQRQNIVAVSSPSRDVNTDIVFQLTRAVNLVAPAISSGAAQLASAPPVSNAQGALTAKPTIIPPASTRIERPVRLAALDGQKSHFTGLSAREKAFEIVGIGENPDIIWDPKSRDVMAWGDVITYRLDKNDLPSVVDRTAAIRELKQMATNTIQTIKTGPDDQLHRGESIVQIELSDVKGRALILFNIAGNGTVQVLYPVGSDSPVIASSDYRFPVKVREPFGADQIVAITSETRMTELEQVLSQLNQRRAPAQIIKMVQRYAPRDARIGSTGIFTAR